MRKILLVCGAAALLAAAPTMAAHVDPIVLTIDSRHYITMTSPVVLSPRERLLQAPEARMANCRRAGGLLPPLGLSRLVYALNGSSVDAQAMRIAFKPTRIVLDTQFGDVVCDGEANGGESGVDRIFRDLFEAS